MWNEPDKSLPLPNWCLGYLPFIIKSKWQVCIFRDKSLSHELLMGCYPQGLSTFHWTWFAGTESCYTVTLSLVGKWGWLALSFALSLAPFLGLKLSSPTSFCYGRPPCQIISRQITPLTAINGYKIAQLGWHVNPSGISIYSISE